MNMDLPKKKTLALLIDNTPSIIDDLFLFNNSYSLLNFYECKFMLDFN